jgi:hypothetical protein
MEEFIEWRNAHKKDNITQMKWLDGGHSDNEADTWPWVFVVGVCSGCL